MKRPGRAALFCTVLLFVTLALPSAAQEPRRVLVLSSFGAGDHFIEPVIRGVRRALTAREGLVLSVEYLDVESGADGRHLRHFRSLLSAKYADANVAAIVALDHPALDLALQMREQIAAKAPIIVGEAKELSAERVNTLFNVTGVAGGYEIERTLDVMSELHPDRKTVVVVDDDSVRGLRLRRDFSHAKARFSQRFEFRDISGQTIAALERELAALGSDHLVFYLSFVEDPSQGGLGYFDALGRASQATGVPVYGAFEDMVGYGIVGGYVLSLSRLGETLGRQVLGVLEGQDTATIPLVDKAPHRYLFDFRELERFGLSLDDLPPESRVIEEPDTFYYRYRHYVWIAVAVFGAIVFYVFQLLVSIQKRDKARRGLERLVEEGKHPLSVDRPAILLREIVDRLKTVAPFLEPLGTYRYAAATEASETGTPVAVGENAAGATGPEPRLARQAIETGRNQFDRKRVLLVLNNRKLPANLAYFRARHRLDAFDQRLVDIFTRDILIECENTEAVRLSSSLETARRIQEAMLPKRFEETARAFDVDVHAVLRPARQVSGDLYDVFALDSKRLCFLVGDVSGKGVPAALFMAMTKTLIRTAAETRSDPGAIVAKANSALCRDNSSMMFVTLFCGVYDRDSKRLAYTNAGHNPPLLRAADGRVSSVPVDTNMALGVSEDITFPTRSLRLQAGESLLVFTDGMTEATNAEEEHFRQHRLESVLAAQAAVPAEALLGALVAAVDDFVGHMPQSDDLTLLCLRRAGAAGSGRASA